MTPDDGRCVDGPGGFLTIGARHRVRKIASLSTIPRHFMANDDVRHHTNMYVLVNTWVPVALVRSSDPTRAGATGEVTHASPVTVQGVFGCPFTVKDRAARPSILTAIHGLCSSQVTSG